MAQAILTKFIGPTNARGSRVKVTGWQGSTSVAWDHALSVEENHSLAVAEYVHSLNKERAGDYQWSILQGGSMPDSRGYAVIIGLSARKKVKKALAW